MQLREEVQTWRGQIDPSGRLLIPAQSRAVMGWERGTDVVIETDGDSLRVLTLEQFTREVQGLFGTGQPDEPMWSEQLQTERKREAKRAAGSD